MATDYTPETTTAEVNTTARTMGILSIVAGVIMILAAGLTWFVVTDQLAAENITVPPDAACAAGESVDGPISAYCMADIINTHSLESTNGLTYAELDREDPLRDVAQNASFLRASLFTSVVSYGVAAMAAGIGLVFILLGAGLNSVAKR